MRRRPTVIAGLDPAIHRFAEMRAAFSPIRWTRGSSPRVTSFCCCKQMDARIKPTHDELRGNAFADEVIE
jgi:hypothetical protein